MPFTSGTVQTVTKLLNAMNSHLILNGWTKLQGETDMNCASPKAARYWRLLVWETDNTGSDFREVNLFALKTLVGGSVVSTTGTYTGSSVETGTPASLGTGGASVHSADIDDKVWWLKYDHGSAVTIREFDLQCGNAADAPRDFCIQWSNDDRTWTTMQAWTGQSWVNFESKTFTFDDLTLYSEHESGTEPRRTGRAEDESGLTEILSTDWYRDISEDHWVWQGDGYDASRRVYIHARGQSRTAASTSWIEWDFAVEHNAANDPIWNQQVGSSNFRRSHIIGSGEIDYWFYTNSKRMILVTRTGSQDYACSYIGFHSAFALPDDYPFPLSIFSTGADGASFDVSDFNAQYSVPDEPGTNSSWVRLWDGTGIVPQNRDFNAGTNHIMQYPPESWIWPKHLGNTQRANWPNQWLGDYADNVPPHGWNFISRTAQDDVPFFPATIQHETYGNIGVLDGLYSVPGAGSLTPTQVINISGQDYRIFPNRNRRSDSNWFAIRED